MTDTPIRPLVTRLLRPALFLAFAGLGLPAQAALSGYYDSLERIGMILGDPRLPDMLKQQPIGSIGNTGTRKDGASEWTIRTQDCDLVVYLIPILPDGPGKTTYQLDIPNGCD
ncbi:hypothetical protein [Rhizobium sp. AAP43]|uniref:hypothetical protein n=1 Tax=Rhizobium sp. AAP43 TaxID=1523420 RepID=UPI0012E23557|nr:hypothetical protein [Rhizobium sp. AAP43]